MCVSVCACACVRVRMRRGWLHFHLPGNRVGADAPCQPGLIGAVICFFNLNKDFRQIPWYKLFISRMGILGNILHM
jgi:hypothetical protein